MRLTYMLQWDEDCEISEEIESACKSQPHKSVLVEVYIQTLWNNLSHSETVLGGTSTMAKNDFDWYNENYCEINCF